MCNYQNERLVRLLESVKKMSPLPEATPEERAWYRGTLHGLMLAIQQVPREDKKD